MDEDYEDSETGYEPGDDGAIDLYDYYGADDEQELNETMLDIIYDND